MKIKRRSFLKGTAGVAGGGALASLLSKGPKTLVEAASGGEAAAKEEVVPTTCWIGKQDCGILARKVNGRVVKLEGHPANPKNWGTLCPKGQAQIMAVYDPNRVKAPLIRTNEKGVTGKWRQASWDEALTLVGNKIKEVRKKDKRLLIWQKDVARQKTSTTRPSSKHPALPSCTTAHIARTRAIAPVNTPSVCTACSTPIFVIATICFAGDGTSPAQAETKPAG